MNDATLIIIRLAVIAVLYLFLALVIGIAWRDLAAAVPGGRATMGRAFLVVIDAPRDVLGTGDRFPIEGVASIGRDSDNQVVVPDRTVSGRHAALSFREGRWWVQDLGSTNGTWMHDHQISGPEAIDLGDTFQVGRISLQLVR